MAGHTLTYYLAQENQRGRSSISLDMSGEFLECVYIFAIRYNGRKIAVGKLPDAILDRCIQDISLVGLEPK